MIVENQLYPSSETIASLLADVSDKRIVMLNLLKFRAHAAYDDGRTYWTRGVLDLCGCHAENYRA